MILSRNLITKTQFQQSIYDSHVSFKMRLYFRYWFENMSRISSRIRYFLFYFFLRGGGQWFLAFFLTNKELKIPSPFFFKIEQNRNTEGYIIYVRYLLKWIYFHYSHFIILCLYRDRFHTKVHQMALVIAKILLMSCYLFFLFFFKCKIFIYLKNDTNICLCYSSIQNGEILTT